MTPITIGVAIPARFVTKLKMAPVNPIRCSGAMSEMMAQPRPVIPCEKKATERIVMTTASLAA